MYNVFLKEHKKISRILEQILHKKYIYMVSKYMRMCLTLFIIRKM